MVVDRYERSIVFSDLKLVKVTIEIVTDRGNFGHNIIGRIKLYNGQCGTV